MSGMSEALRHAYKTKDAESFQAFKDAVRQASIDNELVFLPVSPTENGMEIGVTERDGLAVMVMFTTERKVKQNYGANIAMMEFNKLIDSVYINPRISGFVVDPGSADSLCLLRHEIAEITGRPDPRAIKKDWGKGIPKYNQWDLMVDEEKVAFAAGVLANYCRDELGYTLERINYSPKQTPNIVCRDKDGKRHFITVQVEVAPKMPELNDKEKEILIAFANENDAICEYAPVGIGAADIERFNSSLALYGDEYFINFKGFEQLN